MYKTYIMPPINCAPGTRRNQRSKIATHGNDMNQQQEKQLGWSSGSTLPLNFAWLRLSISSSGYAIVQTSQKPRHQNQHKQKPETKFLHFRSAIRKCTGQSGEKLCV